MLRQRAAVLLLSLIMGIWAVPVGTAHSFAQQSRSNRSSVREPLPRSVSFREVRGRGLLVKTWINGVGPYSFSVDTGAGVTLLSPRVAGEARVAIKQGKSASLAGMSGVTVSAQEATVHSLALGDLENRLPAKGVVMVTTGLPRDLDGVLDPAGAFAPLGYVIDIPASRLSWFNPRDTPLGPSDRPPEGAVVPWLRQGGEDRPFVQLDNGDRALLDTGSSLGFAIRGAATPGRQASDHAVRDVGGGIVTARRGRPATIAVGSLVLRNVPTDFITGADADAPVLLGLNALRPFRLSFDPLHRLIEIVPGARAPR